MTRVLIVGAGPAGIRAAATFVEAGIRPVVVDEGTRAGGQIYRRSPEEFSRSAQLLYGSEAGKAIALHQLFDSLVAQDRVVFLPNRTVVGLSGRAAYLVGPVIGETIPYDQLILATGAMDRVVPLPGWQAPGVYTLGAAQIALKAQGIALGREIVLAGSGPLLTLVAAQLLKAGAQIAAVLDTAPLWSQMRGGLEMALARPRVTARGLGLRAQLGRRYHAGVTLKGIETDVQGPTAVHWVNGFVRTQVTKCDVVALGWHLQAETALADLAGAAFDWSETWAQWLPRCDDEGRAGPQLYLAGDGMSILGADGAEVAGRLAARACLEDIGLPVERARQANDLKRLRRMRRFAEGIARAFPWPAQMVRRLPDDTVVCRCEGVTAGELRAVLSLSGAEANRVKSLGRVGMGRCQGRYCQLAGAELIAGAAGLAPAKVGRLRAQPPVRPAPVAALVPEREEGRS